MTWHKAAPPAEERLPAAPATTRSRQTAARSLETLHTHKKKTSKKKPIFTNLKKRFEHMELPAKLLDYFLRSNKSNIDQCSIFNGLLVERAARVRV
jgi:hypothetical protein